MLALQAFERGEWGGVIHSEYSLFLARDKIAGKIHAHAREAEYTPRGEAWRSRDHSQSKVGTSQRNLDAPVQGIRGGL